MAKEPDPSPMTQLAFKIIAPLVVSTICATAVILWTFSPSIAQNTRAIDELKYEVDATEREAKEANERQIQIRLKLSQMDSKLDTVIGMLRKSKNEHRNE